VNPTLRTRRDLHEEVLLQPGIAGAGLFDGLEGLRDAVALVGAVLGVDCFESVELLTRHRRKYAIDGHGGGHRRQRLMACLATLSLPFNAERCSPEGP
jgi:hypothetical protein